jgi:hypothetical protein
MYEGDVTHSSLIWVGSTSGQKVEGLEGLLMRGAGGQVASDKAWVRVSLEKMCEAGMVTAKKKLEVINHIARVLG